jgi:hypothetical protein
VYDRYLPLVDRLGTRAEFSDLMWEMQGELGTSHAYEMGGDYRQQPNYGQGLLGADLEYDPKAGGYRVVHVVRGDSWNPKADSPLNAPGINAGPGDVLTAVEGRALTADLPPDRLLVHRAGTNVSLTFAARRATRSSTASTSASSTTTGWWWTCGTTGAGTCRSFFWRSWRGAGSGTTSRGGARPTPIPSTPSPARWWR